MNTYRNKYFTKRNYECQNMVACVAETAPVTADDRWVLATENEAGMVKFLDRLYVQAGVTYYGHG